MSLHSTRGELPWEVKEELRVAILQVVRDVLATCTPKIVPSETFIEVFLSEEVRRLVAIISNGLVSRHLDREYLVVYYGTCGQSLMHIVQVEVEDIVALKAVMEKSKPDWALRAQAFPLATKIEADKGFPMFMYWPKLEGYEEVARASIRYTSASTGRKKRYKKSL